MPRLNIDIDVDLDEFTTDEIFCELMYRFDKLDEHQRQQLKSKVIRKSPEIETVSLLDEMKKELLVKAAEENTYWQLQQKLNPLPEHMNPNF